MPALKQKDGGKFEASLGIYTGEGNRKVKANAKYQNDLELNNSNTT